MANSWLPHALPTAPSLRPPTPPLPSLTQPRRPNNRPLDALGLPLFNFMSHSLFLLVLKIYEAWRWRSRNGWRFESSHTAHVSGWLGRHFHGVSFPHHSNLYHLLALSSGTFIVVDNAKQTAACNGKEKVLITLPHIHFLATIVLYSFFFLRL